MPERPRAALGFGCSALVGGHSPDESLELLEVAFDAGITHFDVARVYGSGDAEEIVGRFAAGRRDALAIVTKFGIDPVRATRSTAALKRVVRFASRRSRSVRDGVRRHAGTTVRRGLFSADHARSSLEVSLRALRTDHVEGFLLHDCAVGDWLRDDVRDTLGVMVGDGLVRAVGPASSAAVVREILAADPGGPDIVQLDADVARPNAADLAGPLTITHGCFREVLPLLRRHVTPYPAVVAEWSRAIDADMASVEVIGDLLLCGAMAANSTGTVLFSSSNPDRVRRYARLADDIPYTAEQLASFGSRAAALVATTATTS